MSDEWTFERLRSLFERMEISDEVLRRAAPHLNTLDDHLPPAEFDQDLSELADDLLFAFTPVKLDADARDGWQDAVDLTFRQRAVEVIEAERTVGRTDKAKARWKSALEALHRLRDAVENAKERQLRTTPYLAEEHREQRSSLVALQERMARVEAFHNWQLKVLRQVERYHDANGELPVLPSATRLSFGTPTNQKHFRRAKLLLYSYDISAKSDFVDKAKKINWPDELGSASGEAIWKGVRRLGRTALDLPDHDPMKRKYNGISGMKRLVRDLDSGKITSSN